MGQREKNADFQGVSIVILGDFRPLDFNAEWFSENNLIRPEEAATADIQRTDQEVSLSTEWFALQITGDRFVAATQDPTKLYPLRDLVWGTVKLLDHTPFRALGFNTLKHFSFSSDSEWSAFCNYFAPRNTWAPLLSNPEMESIVLTGSREKAEDAEIRLQIRSIMPHTRSFIIQINEHRISPDNRTVEETNSFLLNTLEKKWSGFLQYCEQASSHIIQVYKENV